MSPGPKKKPGLAARVPLRFLALVLLLALRAEAHHPDPGGFGRLLVDPVLADVPADPSDLEALRARYELLGYRWREGVAVIRAERGDLPAGATIDEAGTAALARPIVARKGAGGIPGFPCYRTVAETEAALAALADAHPTLARWERYGESWARTVGLGGRDLHALVIDNEAIPGPKPVLLIMAAMHARELATAEAATRFAEWLLAGYGKDADRSWLVDHVAIHVLPQHNPDGRELVETTDLLRRKNVNDAYCAVAPKDTGADLNRNAGTFFWGGPSASASECSDTFRGQGPASEPETAALEAYVAAVFPDQRDGDLDVGAGPEASGIFLSVHSFGEYVFYPWEGADLDTGDEAGYQALTQRMGFLTGYAACQNCCLGIASGTAVDQAYEAVGAAALTIELGTSFGQSCASFESRVWPEALTIFTYAARAARRPYTSSLGPRVTDLAAALADDGVTLTISATARDGDYAVNHSCPRRDEELTPGAVARVFVTVDAPPWQAGEAIELEALDGAFDATTEAARVSVPAGLLGTAGRAQLFAVAEDDAGHQGPPTAIFVTLPPQVGDPEVLFASSFEADD